MSGNSLRLINLYIYCLGGAEAKQMWKHIPRLCLKQAWVGSPLNLCNKPALKDGISYLLKKVSWSGHAVYEG